MDRNLTLRLDEKVIEKAKSYARKRNTSLSKLIESYLEHITNNNRTQQVEIAPKVKSLSGILIKNKSSDYRNRLYISFRWAIMINLIQSSLIISNPSLYSLILIL